jgi:novobiocin biosynthesis protein NovU/D-mycarose 3-C-methyltransferase
MPVAGYLEDEVVAARHPPRYELAIGLCGVCGLVQQAGTEARDLLVRRVYAGYQPTYSMSDGVSSYMEAFLSRAVNVARIEAGECAVEIGSNDGRVLGLLERDGIRAVGFEPASGLAQAARDRGVEVISDYFSVESAEAFAATHPRAKLIIARHVLEHDFTPLDFLRGIAAILDRGGLAVIEVPYLRLQMIQGQFQSMTFQHESFFTVSSMMQALAKAGLLLTDIDFVTMDGGAMIIYACREDAPDVGRRKVVDNILGLELEMRLGQPAAYEAFFERTRRTCSQAHQHLAALHHSGARVLAYGAGGKGQALMNMIGVDEGSIAFVIDDVPGNAGRYVPGPAIEVISSSDSRAQQADVIFITAPTHIQEIVRKEGERWATGTRFLTTAPDLHYVARSRF